MKIPNKIKMFNREYEVEFVDEVDQNHRVQDAMVIFDKQKILIKRDLAKEYTIEIFLHEVVHIIEDQFEMKFKEEEVNQIARGLIEFLENNI